MPQKRVLIVGCGGLGHPLLSYLAGFPLLEIGLVDGDTVEASNLGRQFWFSPEHVGAPKAQVLAEQFSGYHPEILFTPHNIMLTLDNAEEICSKYDLIFGCVDHLAARLCINQLCVHQKKPWINGGAFGWRGEIAAFTPEKGCYNCLFPQEHDSHNPTASLESPPTCGAGQVLNPLCGVVGSWMAAVALPFLSELPVEKSDNKTFKNILYTLNFSPEHSVQMSSLMWQRNAQCGVCDKV